MRDVVRNVRGRDRRCARAADVGSMSLGRDTPHTESGPAGAGSELNSVAARVVREECFAYRSIRSAGIRGEGSVADLFVTRVGRVIAFAARAVAVPVAAST
eukprot:1963213-Pleurochrysis_carterae.AAC.1